MSEKRKAKDASNKDNLSVIAEAGGFIAGSLVRHFLHSGLSMIPTWSVSAWSL